MPYTPPGVEWADTNVPAEQLKGLDNVLGSKQSTLFLCTKTQTKIQIQSIGSKKGEQMLAF